MRLFILLFLVSCAGIPPFQDRKIKVWNGSPEYAGICRMSSKNLKRDGNLGVPLPLLKKIHQGTTGYECIQATDQTFKQYACLTFDDLGVLNAYIEKLILSCKKWD